MGMYIEGKEKDYIEKECGIYNSNTGYGGGICPEDPTVDTSGPYGEVCERWKWLLTGWDKMTYVQKSELFFPIVHFIDCKDIEQEDFDQHTATEITEFGMKKCRRVMSIKYDHSRIGAPTYCVVYAPIDLAAVPDSVLRSRMKSFGIANGYIPGEITTVACNLINTP